MFRPSEPRGLGDGKKSKRGRSVLGSYVAGEEEEEEEGGRKGRGWEGEGGWRGRVGEELEGRERERG